MALLNFTPEENNALRALISEMMNARQNRLNFGVELDDYFSPEVYVALAPSGGIPAIDSPGTGTQGDEPGSAECNVFQIVDGELLRTGNSQTVYNISDSAIPQGWVLVVRDKYGKWIAVTGGAAGETCDPRNEIHDIVFVGKPDAGYVSFLLTVNGVEETLILYWNSTSTYVQTVWESHSQISPGDVLVTGGPLPNSTIRMEFQGALAATPILPPLANWVGLGDIAGSGTGTGTGTAVDGTGVSALAYRVQAGFSP